MSVFNGATCVTIPEGNVARITDGSGVVIWEIPATGDLPVGYTQIDYIEFTGEQIIDTGIVPTQNTTIEITFVKKSSASIYLYGVRNSANTASVTAYLASSGAWRFGNTYRNFTLAADMEHTAVANSSGIKMDGNTYNYGSAVKTFTANASLIIGSSRSTSGGMGTPQFVGTISAFKMLDGDTVVAEYIPCKNPNGVVGMWDKTSGSFKHSLTDVELQY